MSTTPLTSCTGHAFWRDPSQGLLGLYGSWVDWSPVGAQVGARLQLVRAGGETDELDGDRKPHASEIVIVLGEGVWRVTDGKVQESVRNARIPVVDGL